MARRSYNDGKDADALRTIGELGKALGIKAHVLRYWEEQFPMLQPLKRSGGRRYYRTDDVALVEAIDRLVNEEGYTLKGARSAIEQGRAGMNPEDGKQPEPPRKGVHRYLTARDLPDRDEPAGQQTHPRLRRAADRALLEELKTIREGLAAAIAD